MREVKRREMIVTELRKSVEERTKEEMKGLKRTILEEYRVVLHDADLRSLIEQWSSSLRLEVEVLKANGIPTSK